MTSSSIQRTIYLGTFISAPHPGPDAKLEIREGALLVSAVGVIERCEWGVRSAEEARRVFGLKEEEVVVVRTLGQGEGSAFWFPGFVGESFLFFFEGFCKRLCVLLVSWCWCFGGGEAGRGSVCWRWTDGEKLGSGLKLLGAECYRYCGCRLWLEEQEKKEERWEERNRSFTLFTILEMSARSHLSSYLHISPLSQFML